ncbi:hypothetical protein AB0J52_00830 [Spirillospora sp. NPDC049652]
MSDNHHPDPFTEGLTLSGQRVSQIAMAAVMGVQAHNAIVRRLAEARRAKDEAAAEREHAALRATREEARIRWTPAHDREWLNRANLYEVGQAWAAAQPYINTVKPARSAADKCEARLRALHPYAMQRYDELRREGKDRPDAMREAAPYFTKAPNTRTGEPAPARPALSQGTGTTWAANPHGPTRADLNAAQQSGRAQQVAANLRAKAREKGHYPSPVELRSMLETTTNLPEHAITKAVPLRSPSRRTGSGIATPEGELADAGFPFTIDEALAVAASQPAEHSAARRKPNPTPDRNRRRNR